MFFKTKPSNRSSHRRCSLKKVIFTGKYLHWSPFFSEVIGLQACIFVKKRLRHRCFSVNVANFLRAPTLKDIWEHFNTETVVNAFKLIGNGIWTNFTECTKWSVQNFISRYCNDRFFVTFSCLSKKKVFFSKLQLLTC